MKTLKITTQFKKDLKRYKNRPNVLEKLEFILGLLQKELPIPEENKPHPLTGNYRGHMECHVENDTLLIWWDKESDIIKLVRFGTHSELF
ncbi:MAG: type II toxin-antitoxin system YafQ family toxin [Bacteroides sp.]|nr:type II toxin-antitoxin system YafQ family toxin [Bacteroides sp.]MBD5415783.1 type II toxin-antitoxin system YafQ family toxin [Bacteroides sp.]